MCKRTLPLSPFQKMDADQCGSFEWKTFVEDLKKKAPTLHAVFSCIVSRSDQHPNSTHYPGLCMSVAILLKERNREMSGLQYIVSLLLYSSHVDKQVSDRNALMHIDNIGICMSYTATLSLLDEISKLHTRPLAKWIGDNVDKKRGARDVRSDHHGSLLHMYSILAGRSRIPPSDLSHTGCVVNLSSLPANTFLPTSEDIVEVKKNLIIIVARIITKYIDSLSPLAKSVTQHIEHQYSAEMSQKSEVIVLDVLMKNEASRADMLDIMNHIQGYLGKDFPSDKRVLSGGDQLTCERQVGAQRHVMDGNTTEERLGLLEPVTEDWHCLVCLLSVSSA